MFAVEKDIEEKKNWDQLLDFLNLKEKALGEHIRNVVANSVGFKMTLF